MAKQKRKVVLPRLTLLAYSRKDLVAFTEAVEALRHITADLRLLVDQLGRKVSKPRPRPAAQVDQVEAPPAAQEVP